LRSYVVPSRSLNGSRKAVVCPVCYTAGSAPYTIGRDRLFGLARETFALYRCRLCGCVFQHPLPEDWALAEFYPQEYWWNEAHSENGIARLFRRLERSYREFVVADHVRFLDFCARGNRNSGKLLLDIGCGSGTFLHVARSHGFVPHGMDASARAVEIARKLYGLPVRQGEIGSKIWGDNQFDFITMFHILEHLPDPRRALRYAGGLLKPGGTLIIQVPNVSSIQARVFRSLWVGLDVPRHVINFTPNALGILLRET
jgi:2-polyprenyl-3-methyl-5-hydroxy-6-metoxy-1,4-benzoquinol methylase